MHTEKSLPLFFWPPQPKSRIIPANRSRSLPVEKSTLGGEELKVILGPCFFLASKVECGGGLMKRFGPATCVAAVLFAAMVATVRLTAQEPQPNALTTQNAKSFTTLYSFQGTDGANPYARVIMDAAHNLYGTTINGGAYGNGTVFKLGTSGNETVLYNFTGGSDGLWPYAGVKLDDAGNLYGTTHSGVTYGDGT